MHIEDMDSASTLARRRVDELEDASGEKLEIVPAATREIALGWVFFFNTADFVRTGDPTSALAGNGPLLVTRNGAIHQLPSAIPWEEAVRKL